MNRQRNAWSVRAFAVLVFALLPAAPQAQPLAGRAIELDGETLHFAIRVFAADATIIEPGLALEPTTALNTAWLIGRFLSAGASEDAAMLSNSPRRRFEVLREYQSSVGDEGFRQVFAEYFEPGNRVVAELTIGDHSLLVWRLREAGRYAGQYFVRVEGKVFMDDVPNPVRTRLRRLLEAIRTGNLPLPGQ